MNCGDRSTLREKPFHFRARAQGGRPKGRKNDKTLEKEAREKVMALMRAEQERLQRDENDV